MAVLDRIATARDDTFAARCAMLLMKIAMAVFSEDAGTQNHANRVTFAQKVLKGAVNNKLIAAAVIAHNPTIQSEIDAAASQLGANIPDNDLEYELGQIFNFAADAYAV